MVKGKIKRPFYKRVWFWVTVVIIVIIIAANAGGNNVANTTNVNSSQKTATQNNTTSNKVENKKVLIPGLTASDIKINLENTWKLKFSGPKQADNMYLDRGEVIDSDTGVKLICTIYEYSPTEIYSIDFVVDASALVGTISTNTINEVSKGYLGYCATAPYNGSDGKKAQEWIQNNVAQVIKAGEIINTTISEVKFELFGTQYIKTLRLTPIK